MVYLGIVDFVFCSDLCCPPKVADFWFELGGNRWQGFF